MPDVLIDGQPASVEALSHVAAVNYGAVTSFRVDGDGVRGLDLHLARLKRSALDLFGAEVGEAVLRRRLSEALDGRRDAWVRVSLFSAEISMRDPTWIGAPSVMVAVSDAPAPLAGPVRVQAQVYTRDAPHLKHAATFGLIRARRTAKAAGFDDALFVDADGRIAEGSIWNIGFVQCGRVVWPEASMLDGVGQALIERGLEGVGLTSETRPVQLGDLTEFDAAFLCNSATPACPIAAIGDHAFAVDAEMIDRLETAVRSQPCQPI
jgi:branched-subunit amino acid aminotransferase/4-amino-4-deoxychorismate lyase